MFFLQVAHHHRMPLIREFFRSQAKVRWVFLLIIAYLHMVGMVANAQAPYPGKNLAGPASIEDGEERIALQNQVISLSFSFDSEKISGIEVTNLTDRAKISFSADSFIRLVIADGTHIGLSDLYFASPPEVIPTRSGKQVELSLVSLDCGVSLEWKLILDDNQHFIRQFVGLNSRQEIREINVLPISSGFPISVIGEVDGSPIVVENFFFAIESPFFTVTEDRVGTSLSVIPYDEGTELNGPHQYQESFVIGTYINGQLRRAFAYYLEKIRVKPYEPITFYDSWYDLSYDLNVLTEEDCIDRVRIWSDSLGKRSLDLDYFLWDSGWDDWNNMWNFNPKLANGFTDIKEEAKRRGSRLGVWLSPWGGYDSFFPIRIENARERYQIFKVDDAGKYNIYKGLTLKDPHYYQYFKGVMLDLIKNHGVNLFKIDGMGPGKDATGPGKYGAEMYELVKLVKEVRKYAPDVHIYLTVGTWASPFWLLYADNIWKGGSDYGYGGDGNNRQRWMTFRDMGILNGVTKRAPLLPISAVMLHGVTIADRGAPARYENDDQYIEQDIWSFFGSGTSLQELYVNPHKLNTNNWDVLAKAMKWARSHKETLIDANWVGGDPALGEVYGYAAWSPEKSTLMLRNPSAMEQQHAVLLDEVLELPTGYQYEYELYNVVKETNLGATFPSQLFEITLEPFEVMVLNIAEVKSNL